MRNGQSPARLSRPWDARASEKCNTLLPGFKCTKLVSVGFKLPLVISVWQRDQYTNTWVRWIIDQALHLLTSCCFYHFFIIWPAFHPPTQLVNISVLSGGETELFVARARLRPEADFWILFLRHSVVATLNESRVWCGDPQLRWFIWQHWSSRTNTTLSSSDNSFCCCWFLLQA